MIGDGYWSTGITVKYGYASMGCNGWAAEATYLDGGFCNDDPANGVISTEGTLHTRYVVREQDGTDVLTAIIDAVKADAERLGVSWLTPHVYYKGDGEDENYPPPEGWREMIDAQAARLGWESLYSIVSSEG